MNWHSVGVRLTARYLAVLAIGLALFAAAIWIAMDFSLHRALDQSLTSRLHALGRYLDAEALGNDLPAIAEEVREYASGLPAGHSLVVRDRNGAVIYATRPDLLRRRIHVEPLTARGHALQAELGAPVQEVQDTLRLLGIVLLSAIPIVLLAAGLAGWWLSRRALAPVDRITEDAEALSVQDLSARLHVPSTGDEFERLASAWNRMLDRIEGTVQRVTRFTTDAAHELRTPIAVIRTSAELSLRQERSPASYQQTLSGILHEGENLTHLVDQLMFLARHDSGALSLRSDAVSLPHLLEDVHQSLEPIARDRHISFQLQLAPVPVHVSGDRGALRRLLVILADNALQFTPPGGTITVRLTSQQDRCSVAVTDTGIGIHSADMPHLFERFYRADRSRSTPGHGLGLAIAMAIARSHQAELTVDSQPGQGATFTLSLSSRDVSADVPAPEVMPSVR